VLNATDSKLPTSKAATGSVAGTDSSPRAVVAPVVMVLALLLLVVAAGLWWSRRDSAQRSRERDALG
jgi:hypothetical protein